MTATVAYLQNAFTPQHRQLLPVESSVIRALAPDWKTPFVAVCNGEVLLRRDWDQEIGDGDLLAFVDVRMLPQGGGNGGSNPLQMLLMIVVMIYAPYLGAAAYTAMGGTAAAGAVMAGQAAVFAGMMLVNAMFPPPKLPTTHQLQAPSPTYTLAAQGNQARIDSAVPEHFGRLRCFPDFAAQPYTEFSGNEQFLYQLLVVGRGEYDIEAIRIEDTSISSFDEITYEVLAPHVAPSLFPADVVSSVEVAGQELQCVAATYSQVGTVLTVTWVAHGLSTGRTVHLDFTSGTAADGDYILTAAPTADTFTVTATSATTSGNVTASSWIGGFIANASGTEANALGIDLVAARGLYYGNNDGSLSAVSTTYEVQRRPVDAVGAPTGAWAVLVTDTLTAASTTPQRVSARATVAAGRYEVRARRIDIEQTDNHYGHALAWAGLRAYLAETRDYGDVTLLAMRLRATNNLSAQASRKINVVATRKLSAWTGSAWGALTATRSIAWALAYSAKQVGLLDTQIDLASLLALDATWTARGDHFDGRFDNFLNFWEAASQIAIVGRAKPFMQGGVLRVVRDQPATLPVQLYSMRNIKRGSFNVDYLMPTQETADVIDVGYFDALNWTTARVPARLADSASLVAARIELFGATDRDHAHREGMYQAACNRYRRKLIKFATEMEGFIPSFGDLIAISHDMPRWGQSAEVVAWDSASNTLTLSEPMEFAASGTHYLALRKRDGSVDGPYAVTAGPLDTQVVLGVAPAITPYTDGGEERTHIAFGLGEAWRQRARVVAVKPTDLTHAEITCVNEDDLVHTADTTVVTPPRTATALQTVNTSPTVGALTVTQSNTSATTLLVSWAPAAGANHYLVEQSADGLVWTPYTQTTGSAVAVELLYGLATQLRVAGVGLTRGAWSTVVVSSVIGTLGVVTGLAVITPFVGREAKVAWAPLPGATAYQVKVYVGGLLKRTVANLTECRYTYSYEDATADGGPWRSFDVHVMGASPVSLSAAEATLSVSNPQVAAPSGLILTPGVQAISVDVNKPADTDYAGTLIWMSTTSGFTPDAGTLVYDGPSPNFTRQGLTPGTSYYVRVAHYDVMGQDSLNLSAETATSPNASAGGITVVTSLPTSGTSEGQVVYLTTDKKLYRWNGTAWITSVSSTDIAGTIADSQIAALAASKVTGTLTDAQLAAIAAAKITGTVAGTQIANGAISTAKLAAGAVTANEIAADTITAAKIATGTITATEIAAGTITGAKIAAGTIAAGNIAAGTITATQIAADTITASQIAAGGVTATEINVATLAAIAADLGSITAGNITLDTVGYIRGGQTNWNTGNGFWMGYQGGVYKFSFGNSAGQGINWNGSVLTINGGGTFSGALSAATGTFGALTVASGGNIKQGQTAYNTGTGFWLGDVAGTAKLSIGSAAGAHMNWDGAALDVVGTIEPIYTAGTLLIAEYLGTNGASSTTPVKVRSLVLNGRGTVRVTYQARFGGGTAGTLYSRVYRNGTAVGATHSVASASAPADFSEDIAGWSKGDTLELWCWASTASASSQVANVRILSGTSASSWWDL